MGMVQGIPFVKDSLCVHTWSSIWLPSCVVWCPSGKHPWPSSRSLPCLSEWSSYRKCLFHSFNVCGWYQIPEETLLAISEWSTSTRLQFNSAKCTTHRFYPSDPPTDFPPYVNNSAIIATTSQRDLGITVSNTRYIKLVPSLQCTLLQSI